mgnify:CR=1 FL=1
MDIIPLADNLKDYALGLLKKALGIYSPSRDEGSLAQFLVKEMKSLGYEVHIDDVGNVVGSIGHGERLITLCGHMDTVPGMLPLKVTDRWVSGRGAVDAKSALAAMIVAGSTLAAEKLEGEVMVVGAVDEEGSSLGVNHLVKERLKTCYAVFGEPSGVENITVGYRGRIQVKLNFKTPSGHSGSPWAYENAVEKTYELWAALKSKLEEAGKGYDRYHSVSACITGIRGGEAPNVVPGNCTATFDVRLPPSIKCREAFETITALVGRYRSEHPRIMVDVGLEESTEAFEVEEGSVLVEAFRQSISEVRSRTPKLLRKTGTGDMNVFAITLGTPTVTYGPGDSRLGHTDDERVAIVDYLDSVEVYRRAIMHLHRIERR